MTAQLHRPLAVILAAAIIGCDREPATDPPSTIIATEDLEPIMPTVRFAEVREVVPTERGLWVLDRSAPFVTYISLDDPSHVVRFGTVGEGPAELQAPVGLHPTPTGVDVWDVQLGKRVSFVADGQFLAVQALSDDRSGRVRGDMDRVSHLDPWRVRRMGRRTVYTRLPSGMTHPVDYGRGLLVLADADLGSPTTVSRFADHVPRDERATGQFPAMPLWDACPGDIALWNPRLGRVEWRDVRGNVVESVVVPSDGIAITLGGIERFLRGMARQELGPSVDVTELDLSRRAREVRPAFGRWGTSYVDVRCASDRSVWLRQFDLETDALGAGRSWVRVKVDGSVLQVHFPEGFEPYVFHSDVVIGTVETPHGEILRLWRRIDRRTQ